MLGAINKSRKPFTYLLIRTQPFTKEHELLMTSYKTTTKKSAQLDMQSNTVCLILAEGHLWILNYNHFKQSLNGKIIHFKWSNPCQILIGLCNCFCFLNSTFSFIAVDKMPSWPHVKQHSANLGQL